ncbi:O-antigen polymerase superfamily protein [Alloalcanivorax dieselolei B5]|uniref:O-antigen polymerase superfamily protein n=1 Tax=Alcanivorax dieselolei (strain DSM 16502 / CGMCC 1.3690 / MCCC 1A00001 / B-5) TaxID=930169 RepID=K0CE98_ALCDB|nr:O-antigen ligase family protein [Alloalcanivorax dieselolei]AFT69992.1 O-antigen polymerase superfamily protein [Alloalcanivorax dieselolei B5]
MIDNGERAEASLVSSVLVFFIIFSYWNVHSWVILSSMGRFFLLGMAGAVLFLSFHMITNSGTINRNFFKATKGLFFLLLLYLASSVWSLNPLPLISRNVQILSVIFVLYVFFVLGMRRGGEKILKYILLFSFFAVLFCFALWGFGGSDGGFDNPNVVGLWASVMAVSVLATRKVGVFFWIPFLIASLLVFLSGSRTALGGMLSGMLLYFFWPALKSNRLLFWFTLFFIFFLSSIMILLISGVLGDLSDANQVMREISGKNLLSGRDVAWPIVIDLIKEKPFLGWGGGVNLSDITDFHFSAHNYYLQTAMQTGLTGLLFLLFSICCVWNALWFYRDGSLTRTASALFVVVIMSQNFEVTLLQNNMALSYPMWMLLGLAFGVAQREKSAEVIK